MGLIAQAQFLHDLGDLLPALGVRGQPPVGQTNSPIITSSSARALPDGLRASGLQAGTGSIGSEVTPPSSRLARLLARLVRRGNFYIGRDAVDSGT